MTQYDSTKDTLDHIKLVGVRIFEFISNLKTRAKEHDLSKLKSPEKEAFDEFTPNLRSLTYGSEEYKESLQKLGVALEHHYKSNKHHPEYYGYAECNICFSKYPRDYQDYCKGCMNTSFTLRPDINKMSLVDVIEMVADWKAATERHADGNFKKSLEINKNRLEISDQLFSIIYNTALELGWI